MSLLISIIIPVYNVSEYLDDCIHSLLKQSYQNCEFIFINDGSTDHSLEILERHQKKDSRIKLINQENRGVSIARNNGIAMASGTYMGFVDSDDWIEWDMYQTLFETMESFQCDLVLSNMRSFLDGKEYSTHYDFPVNEKLEVDYVKEVVLPYLIENDNLYSSCNKLFKTAIIKENNIVFPKGNALSEDNIFNLLYFNKIQSMVYLDYTGYNYREVVGSATRNVIKNNYFKNVLSIYHFDYNSMMDLKLEYEEINKIKGIKLIENILPLVHIYFNPSNKLSLKERCVFVKDMITTAEVQQELQCHFEYFMNKSNRYETFLLKSIKEKSIFKLYLATMYSRIRNK